MSDEVESLEALAMAITQRDEARTIACKLLTERNEARRQLAALPKAIKRAEFLQEKQANAYDITAHLMRQSALMVRMYQAHWQESTTLKADLAKVTKQHEDKCRNFREQITVLRSALTGLKSALMGYGHDEYEIARMGYEVDRAEGADGD